MKPLAELIACPYCRAHVTEPCRSPTGRVLPHPHTCRLAGHLCGLCGALLPARTTRGVCARHESNADKEVASRCPT